jgi:hypothetical protein
MASMATLAKLVKAVDVGMEALANLKLRQARL